MRPIPEVTGVSLRLCINTPFDEVWWRRAKSRSQPTKGREPGKGAVLGRFGLTSKVCVLEKLSLPCGDSENVKHNKAHWEAVAYRAAL